MGKRSQCLKACGIFGQEALGGLGQVSFLSQFYCSRQVFDLLKAYQKILDNKLFEKDYEVEITEMSVTDQIQHIIEILNASESVTFESLFTVLNTKQEVVVTFLAILELMRLKLLRVQQARHFETIRIYKAADQEAQDAIMREYQQTMGSDS